MVMYNDRPVVKQPQESYECKELRQKLVALLRYRFLVLSVLLVLIHLIF